MCATCYAPRSRFSMSSRGRHNKPAGYGHTWWYLNITPEEQAAWKAIRGAWATATDEEIAEAKATMLKVFPFAIKHNEVKGMACHDFIHLFNNTQTMHFFMPTDGKQKYALCYDCRGGQANLVFAPDCTFESVKKVHWQYPVFKVSIYPKIGEKPIEFGDGCFLYNHQSYHR